MQGNFSFFLYSKSAESDYCLIDRKRKKKNVVAHIMDEIQINNTYQRQ